MPCLTITYDPNIGPVINVGFTNPGESRNIDSQPKLNLCPLLVDTGADVSCVDTSIISNLGIRPISKKMINGATGTSELNVYLVDLLIPFGDPLKAPPGTVQTLVVNSIQVIGFKSNSPAYRGLLGRDVLSRGMLSIEGWNSRLTFCI